MQVGGEKLCLVQAALLMLGGRGPKATAHPGAGRMLHLPLKWWQSCSDKPRTQARTHQPNPSAA